VRVNPLISIIDDDDSVRSATVSLLHSMGYATECFDSAEAFLCSGDAHRFACVLTDIQMPGMSGIDLQYLLVHCDPKVPVILMTARTEEDLHVRARASGAVCLLKKPFAAELLFRCLDAALAS
jgi:FixJ family two-component response regulator